MHLETVADETIAPQGPQRMNFQSQLFSQHGRDVPEVSPKNRNIFEHLQLSDYWATASAEEHHVMQTKAPEQPVTDLDK